ncbi:MAG: hypothetical protein GEU71_13695, partial [Actinobacteria bacterium]|nr:hypothetical protein [Actinomycetota bacterium]
MTASRAVRRKPLAMFASLAVMFALLVPMAGTASAGHTLAHDMNCEDETETNGTTVVTTITCTIDGLDVAGDTTEVDVEFLAGSVNDDDGTSYTSPDDTESCEDGGVTDADGGAADGDCVLEYEYTSADAGTDTIAFWIDDDTNNTTADLDTTEGRDETVTPGDITEPDDTDVVERSWFASLDPQATLDCDDEDSRLDDVTAPRPIEESVTYICTAFVDSAADDDFDPLTEDVISGVVVDAEVEGTNDPDNLGFAAATNLTADLNNVGTTGADGTFTFTRGATEGEDGPVEICFWADFDDDAV